MRYGIAVTIQSWNSDEARAIFEGRAPRRVHSDLVTIARRRLAVLDAATSLENLRALPSNRLHKVGDVWSISVNMQYRITFVWGDRGPEDVWFGDYH